MHVYLVRHGETDLNKKHIHQFPSTPLSEYGREEANTVAEYLREMNPDFLVTSDYRRGLETARIIALHTGLAPESSPLFYEIVRPSSLFGKSHFSFETFKYALLSVLRRNNSAWRYKDAENMRDLILRTEKAYQYLETLSKKYNSVIVVSHSVFMNFFIAHLCNRNPLNFFALVRAFLECLFTKNGTVVHLEYLRGGKKHDACAWQQLVHRYAPLTE